jgi:Protein of unknown function (DUF2852)
MTWTSVVDDIPKPAWIAMAILGFIAFWPIGLGILAYLYWSGKMGRNCNGSWSSWKDRRDARSRFGDFTDTSRFQSSRSSGNVAFDQYRQDTLRRLDEEHSEFQEFMERLRMAKDKDEFDRFMADRAARPAPAPAS